MATASATIVSSPAMFSSTATVAKSIRKPAANKVHYISGLNSFNGLKAHNSVASLGLPECTDQSFAKIVSSLNKGSRGGGSLSATCNAVAEIFKIAAIMNGLTLVGVAVGFVLLRIEAYVEESEDQEVESPVTDLSRPDPDLAADAGGLGEKERENLSLSTFESTDLAGIGPPLEAKGWPSPPDSIYSSSTDSGVTLAESSLPDSFNDEQQFLHRSSSRDATESQHSSALSQTASQEILDSPHRSKFTEAANTPIGSFKSTDPNEYPVDSASQSNESGIVCPDTSRPSNENREMMSGVKDEFSSLNQVIIKDEAREAAHASSRVRRGKNPYATSVLRRVEMKLDGRDISDNREISVSEQVDCLLKQATSVDNLCNMYEGWTPWI